RLIAAAYSRQPRSTRPAPSDASQHQWSYPFRLNYAFAQQVVLVDEEVAPQLVVSFSNRGDVDFSEVDIPVHVCLLLDVSGSMDTQDKYPFLLQAVPELIQMLSDNDFLSIIIFSTRSELV